MTFCSFVPPYLLERVAAAHPDEAVTGCSRDTLAVDARMRSGRAAAGAPTSPAGPFSVCDAGGGTTLPGPVARSADQGPVGDPAVDEAHAGVEASLALFAEAFGRTSYDDRGAPVVATVHYGRDYDNAFWDGRQLVFGDGDGQVFERFTKPVDVLGHEFTHAVTQYTSGFDYSGQSGALNESISDVFASCLKQRLLGQTAEQADWLIGEGIFTPAVQGRALRSMAEPGTAYDDPVLGKDPQVASMADYVETTEDNGGVHLNSGIPNRAFQLAAVALGGPSWELPGRIWYAALTSGIGPSAGFVEFAEATAAAAGDIADEAAREAVVAAWREVGVEVVDAGSGTGSGAAGAASGGTGAGAGSGTPERVLVSRTGGFAGLRREAEVRLGEEDPRAPEVQQLLGRIDLPTLQQATGSPAQPDRYVYAFVVDGDEVVVAEQDLTPELSRLARVVLDD